MWYPIAIEEPNGTAHAFGVVVPDLPGCFSAGDTFDEAMKNAKEAIELWLESVLDDGDDIPEPRTAAHYRGHPDFVSWTWAAVSIDLAELSNHAERVNITLPSRVLRRIDRDAQEAGETRSGYIARKMLR